jgi:poly-gamma-glutamate synthesis protein (capsule biosynthesis protein)
MSTSDELKALTLLFCGDVMTGRGVDQILPHPGDPKLCEDYLHDARHYVQLAESVNGPIPYPVDFSWPWGDALETLAEQAPDACVINLETSVTRSDDFAAGKAVHYRMSPANLPCLTVFAPDVCVLANNHVLDFGRRGLEETVEALASAGLRCVGAGRDRQGAREPEIVHVGDQHRVVVLAGGTTSSGVPPGWAATQTVPGVEVVNLSAASAAEIVNRADTVRRPGDVVVVSLHWGSNWGYAVTADQQQFAHWLIDGGVDVVFGHSSHHPRPIEIYKGKLVLYGCGDFVDDYEGIRGYEAYRGDLRLMYFVTVEADTGELARLRMKPLQARQLRLHDASRDDTEWLRWMLSQVSFGTQFDADTDGMLTLGITD